MSKSAFDAGRVTARLRELVALPSISSADPAVDQSNRAVVDLLGGWLTDLGFTPEVMDVPGKPGKANLIARMGEGDDALVLTGHTDTVPYDAARWATDPFTLTEKDGNLHGLGTSDMKGFAAVIVEVLGGWLAQAPPDRWQRPLTLIFTADEESSMAGAAAIRDGGVAPGQWVIIGEPTGLDIVRAHKGILWDLIRLTGQAAHASRPDLGNNALVGMHRVMTALMDWEKELGKQFPGGDFCLPGPTVNFGALHGGDSPNRVCGQAALKVDVRLVPGMTLADTRAALRERVAQAVADTGLTLDVEAIFEGIEPFDTPADASLVRALETVTGQTATTTTFGTEGPYFQALGCETVVFGPGHIDQAHQPNEFVSLGQLEKAHGLFTRVLTALVS